jgi:short-subunit dehydrogenase
MRRVLILGGASAIALEVARLLAADGDRLYLIDIQGDALVEIAEDLRLRGARSCDVQVADLSDIERHRELINLADDSLGEIDTVLIAYGTLSGQADCEASAAAAMKEIHTNFVSVVSLLTMLANLLEERRRGRICVISSVAGDRGRRNNYVYGSAKGGLTVFLSGLRSRLNPAGISVTTIKAGLVDTPMTEGLNRSGPLWSSPEAAGKLIYRALIKGKGDVYVPGFWGFIMFAIRTLPEFIFKKIRF